MLLGAGQMPDVLVADIDLGPGPSGLDLAAIARERHPAAEVVLISGTAPDSGRPGYSERFLRKPFAPAALAEALRGRGGHGQGRLGRAPRSAERHVHRPHGPGRRGAPASLARATEVGAPGRECRGRGS